MKERLKNKKDIFIYAGMSLLLYFGVTAISCVFCDTGTDWYVSLAKSPFDLPKEVFYMIWALIYACLFVAFFLVLKKSGGENGILFVFFGVMDSFWCFVFFSLHLLLSALLLNAGMLVFSLFLFWHTAKRSEAAAYLTIPYIIWLAVSFILDYDAFILN